MKKIKAILKKSKLVCIIWEKIKNVKSILLNKRDITNAASRKRKALVQILPSLTLKDAIGNSVCMISKELDKMHILNYIVTDCVCEKIDNFVPFSKFKFRKDDTIIFHMSVGSKYSYIYKEVEVAKKIMIYHNITPETYFKTNNEAFKNCKNGREELKKISTSTDLAICDSLFNKKELDKLNYKNTVVVPILHQTDLLLKFKKNIPKDNVKNFITVGRIERHKCIHDVIKIFCIYNKKYFKNSKLFIIGKSDNYLYKEELLKLVKAEGLEKQICFLESQSESDLAKYYSLADAYICMSEHEGLCVPLIEAMAFEIPIFAYDSSAIKETLSSAGVLVEEKNYNLIADLIYETLNDNKILQKIRLEERKRYKHFDNSLNVKKYLNYILN